MGKYIQEMPRIEAERALARVQEMAAAFGSMDERDQRRYIRQLQITATGAPVKATPATAASLAQMKITVETVEGGE